MKQLIEKANAKAIENMKSAKAVWKDIRYAYEVFDPFDKYTLLHAGPPVAYENMSGPMKGAICAAIKYEELADTDSEAFKLAESGKIKFYPCHDFGAVGPMTGIISYSMPLYVVENEHLGNFAYSTINEGAGDVLRFGAHTDRTVSRLKWIERVLAPEMKKTIAKMDGMNLNVLIGQAVHMGDELHMRNGSSTALFIKNIVESLVDVLEDGKSLKEIVSFLTTNNDQFFLNLAMCASKVAADAAHGIEYSTIVTAMARNGVDIGIRISGLGNQWFSAPAAHVDGLYFSGYDVEDANPDLGDSAIMETAGLGGFAMAAAPAIVRFLGAGGFKEAVAFTMDMYEITNSESIHYTIPALDFRGTPLGIDILKVVETGILPVINTAIASKKPGVGMIGAGVSKAPSKMFEDALLAYAQTHGV